MTTVETVRGPVDTASLGRTLAHEHVLNINAEIARDQPDLSWNGDRAATLDKVVAELQDVVDSGISTIVDATAIGHGRDVATLQEINARVDLNIIVSTGIYTFDQLPHFFTYRRPVEPGARDTLTEVFVRDITQGIAGTGVKAAIIKCATDRPGVTPNIDRVLRAVAAAHRETGVPITTHSRVADQNGLEQQRIFAEEGVDLSRVVIGHSGDSQDLDYLRALMDAGSTIGADRFGMYLSRSLTLEQRVETVATLCAEGYADRIVLAHDHTIYSDWFDQATLRLPPTWRQTHISEQVLPALLARGVTEDSVEQMLVGNLRRLFETQGSY